MVNMVKLKKIILDQQSNIKEISDFKKKCRKGNVKLKNLKNRQRIFISQKFSFQLIKKIHEYYDHIGVC